MMKLKTYSRAQTSTPISHIVLAKKGGDKGYNQHEEFAPEHSEQSPRLDNNRPFF